MSIDPDTDIPYAAGWFDSRGFARVSCQRGRASRVRIYIMADSHAGNWFTDRWAGTLQATRGNASRGGYHAWTLEKHPARRFLTDIRPHLRLRGELADQVIEFINRISNGERSNDNLDKLVDKIRDWRVPK